MMYKGQSFCGSVQIEVSGAPAAMGYCHCRSVARWPVTFIQSENLHLG